LSFQIGVIRSLREWINSPRSSDLAVAQLGGNQKSAPQRCGAFFFEGRGRFKTRTRGTGGDGERLIHALPKPALDGSRQSP